MTPHKCPVCEGSGIVARPVPRECNACKGTGIVWEPDQGQPPPTIIPEPPPFPRGPADAYRTVMYGCPMKTDPFYGI